MDYNNRSAKARLKNVDHCNCGFAPEARRLANLHNDGIQIFLKICKNNCFLKHYREFAELLKLSQYVFIVFLTKSLGHSWDNPDELY